jgi:NADPH2:quinone reductase
MKAIRLLRFGDPEVLEVHEIARPEPRPGEALIRVYFAGVNYADVTLRSGLHPWPDPLPLTPGFEAAGVVESVGQGVDEVSVGDRVASLHFGLGAYSEYQALPVDRLVRLPADVTFEAGVALMLQGLTSQVLIFESGRVERGSTVLIHAAAGGMGQLLTRWSKELGATVIGTVSNPDKIAVALAAGADHVIDYSRQDFAAETLRFTSGRGADLVVDGVGKTSFAKNLDAVAARGRIVFYGFASGAPDPFDPRRLMAKSVTLVGENVANHVASREELVRRVEQVFRAHRAGFLRPSIDRVFSLERASEAHRLLEGRATAGKILLALAER